MSLETLALLPDALARVGLTPAQVKPTRPWLLAMTLMVFELQKAGFSKSSGIDYVLLASARGKKRIVELETAEDQVRVLASMPPDVADLTLQDAFKSGPLTAGAFAEMATA